ncbi:hypothetical protein BD413DRAFT_171666 [Trametes elegans]|nr:hypothetical protein BD413DRAFT_171666 [Trametes elegans]
MSLQLLPFISARQATSSGVDRLSDTDATARCLLRRFVVGDSENQVRVLPPPGPPCSDRTASSYQRLHVGAVARGRRNTADSELDTLSGSLCPSGVHHRKVQSNHIPQNHSISFAHARRAMLPHGARATSRNNWDSTSNILCRRGDTVHAAVDVSRAFSTPVVDGLSNRSRTLRVGSSIVIHAYARACRAP